MRTTSSMAPALFFLVLFPFGFLPGAASAADMMADADFGLDYYLTFTPSRPSVGNPVTMTLVSKPGLPPVNSIRWSLSGASASNANVAPGNPSMYSFTPNTPGSFSITAEFNDPQGGVSTVTMELGIGPGLPDIPVPEGYSAGQPVAPDEMYIAVSPSHPRLGQPATFALRFRDGIPQGTQVRWEFAGGPVTGQNVSGANGEICTFTPTAQTSYYVRAVMVDQRGYLTGEVSLGFFPVP